MIYAKKTASVKASQEIEALIRKTIIDDLDNDVMSYEKDKDGNTRSKLEVIKERLNIKNTVRLTVKPTGLNFNELRAMVNLKPKKYSELTTDQLLVLRNKVLFRLENEVMFHIDQWEERIRQLKLVAENRGITLED